MTLVHCSYHKCLTVYYGRIMSAVFNRCLPWKGYRHFNSHLRDFYAGHHAYRLASVNNRAPDLDRLGQFRLSRFIRDPRDLVVSGYLYHRRGVEAWTRLASPTEEDWYAANGAIPEGMKHAGSSFAAYLSSVSEEEGLLAELEFRGPHFYSMAQWPETHPSILTYRYEDIIGRQAQTISELADFYNLSMAESRLCRWFARRYDVHRRAADPHVRDPQPGQWRRYFTPTVRRAFDTQYGALVRQLGYPSD